MTSPLQAAARALCRAQSGVDCFDDLDPEAQELALETARAVILAIRPPSQNMVEAAHAPDRFMMDATVESIWRDMLDAALSEQP